MNGQHDPPHFCDADPELIASLKDENYHEREAAAEVLGKIKPDWPKSEEAKLKVPELISALKDRNNGVREAAAGALGKIGDPRAVDPLSAMLSDKNDYIRVAAAQALFELGDSRGVDVIEDIINNLFALDTPDVFNKSLGKLFGDYTDYVEQAFSYKKNIIHTGDGDVYDYSTETSYKALDELCKINTQISTNLLYKIAERKDIKDLPSSATFSVDIDDSRIWHTSHKGVIGFEGQRIQARNELIQRGNPPYDPSVYLDRRSWQLK